MVLACMRRWFDDTFLEGTEIHHLWTSQCMIDEGYHPMAVFSLVVHGAMLIEPTESESKESLDRFVAGCRGGGEDAKAGGGSGSRARLIYAPRRRLDETAAAEKACSALETGRAAGSRRIGRLRIR